MRTLLLCLLFRVANSKKVETCGDVKNYFNEYSCCNMSTANINSKCEQGDFDYVRPALGNTRLPMKVYENKMLISGQVGRRGAHFSGFKHTDIALVEYPIAVNGVVSVTPDKVCRFAHPNVDIALRYPRYDTLGLIVDQDYAWTVGSAANTKPNPTLFRVKREDCSAQTVLLQADDAKVMSIAHSAQHLFIFLKDSSGSKIVRVRKDMTGSAEVLPSPSAVNQNSVNSHGMETIGGSLYLPHRSGFDAYASIDGPIGSIVKTTTSRDSPFSVGGVPSTTTSTDSTHAYFLQVDNFNFEDPVLSEFTIMRFSETGAFETCKVLTSEFGFVIDMVESLAVKSGVAYSAVVPSSVDNGEWTYSGKYAILKIDLSNMGSGTDNVCGYTMGAQADIHSDYETPYQLNEIALTQFGIPYTQDWSFTPSYMQVVGERVYFVSKFYMKSIDIGDMSNPLYSSRLPILAYSNFDVLYINTCNGASELFSTTGQCCDKEDMQLLSESGVGVDCDMDATIPSCYDKTDSQELFGGNFGYYHDRTCRKVTPQFLLIDGLEDACSKTIDEINPKLLFKVALAQDSVFSTNTRLGEICPQTCCDQGAPPLIPLPPSPPSLPPSLNIPGTDEPLLGTHVGKFGYDGMCQNYYDTEIASGYGTPCEKSVAAINSEWGSYGTFLAPAGYEDTSKFRDFCSKACSSTDEPLLGTHIGKFGYDGMCQNYYDTEIASGYGTPCEKSVAALNSEWGSYGTFLAPAGYEDTSKFMDFCSKACSSTDEPLLGTHIGKFGYDGMCQNYYDTEIASGYGTPCEKSVAALNSEWGSYGTFLAPAGYEDTSKFRDFCSKACSSTDEPLLGTHIGQFGYDGRCQNYYDTEIAGGYGTPCEKSVAALNSEWGSYGTFLAPAGYEDTSKFRDFCTQTCGLSS